MSASIYPPAEFTIYDPGNCPEVWVDGCAYYFEESGIVKTGFYVTEPVMPIADTGLRPETIGRLCFRFRCTVATQRTMKEQVIRLQSGVSTTLRMGARLPS